jgi:uncharacterized protein YggU (UPF0235/DUF167 family)
MLIKVKVFPNSKVEEIIKKSDDEYIVKVKDKAEQGKANKRVKELLANFFSKSENKIILIKGSNQQNKIFKIY